MPSMTLIEAAERIAELSEQIRHHDHRYYVQDAPEISDEAYDELFHELTGLEAEFPELCRPDSPTQRVGGGRAEGFTPVEHTAPMMSLDSDRAEEALRRFDERLRRTLGPEAAVRYMLEPKLDGLSIELVYAHGALVQAATRGDGMVGEGVLANVRTIRTVPLRLDERVRPAPPLLAVRGEVLMGLAVFRELNERLKAANRPIFANARNAAAGSLRQLDPKKTAERPLEVWIYDLLSPPSLPGVSTQQELHEALQAWGLRVPDRRLVVGSVEEVLAFHQALGEERESLPFEIDGVVLKLDDLAARRRLGETSRFPRWAYAHKFPPDRKVTRLLDIEVNVGRTGAVTPVALLAEVSLGGVRVTHASLHNREEVARKDIRVGDLVRVQRAGDVIPQIIEWVAEPTRARGEPWRMPEACPRCGAALVPKGPFTLCPNGLQCTPQLAGRIEHFASRPALDIEGLGEKRARLFVEQGLVRSLSELFDLTASQLLTLPKFASKSVDNLLTALTKARRVELHRLLYGLGIPDVGETTARELAGHFRALAALRTATAEQLQQVEGIGAKMAEAISGFFAEPHNAAQLDLLLARLEVIEPRQAAAGEAPLAGCKFVFTGGLPTLSRNEAKERVLSLGGRVAGSVSRETTHVVSGDKAGSKLDAARKLGVPILDEEAFMRLLRERGWSG